MLSCLTEPPQQIISYNYTAAMYFFLIYIIENIYFNGIYINDDILKRIKCKEYF